MENHQNNRIIKGIFDIMSYNRYSQLSSEGKISFPPNIKYTPMRTDKEEIWRSNDSRMDLISFKYYNDANYDWLILWANYLLPKLEFEIEDQTPIIIPYPLDDALNQYKNGIETYKTLYYID